jgi:creatinine amidohydrolase
MENFPWTRLEGVRQPPGSKPKQDIAPLRTEPASAVRELLGDGSLGGYYERPDDDVLRVWAAGVEETRERLEDGWRA